MFLAASQNEIIIETTNIIIVIKKIDKITKRAFVFSFSCISLTDRIVRTVIQIGQTNQFLIRIVCYAHRPDRRTLEGKTRRMRSTMMSRPRRRLEHTHVFLFS